MIDLLYDSSKRLYLIDVQVQDDCLHVGAFWVDLQFPHYKVTVTNGEESFLIELPPEAVNSNSPLLTYNLELPLLHVQ